MEVEIPLLGNGSSLRFVGRSGSVGMSVGWWEMVSSLCFDRMCGLVLWRLGSVLAGCLIFRSLKRCLCLICVS